MSAQPTGPDTATAELQAEYETFTVELQRLRAEMVAKKPTLNRTKAELSVVVAQIFGRLLRTYGNPETVAARARIEEEDLWWLLSGEFPHSRIEGNARIVQIPETLKNLVVSLARLDPDEPWKTAAEAGQHVDRYVRLLEEDRTLSRRREEVRIRRDRVKRLIERTQGEARPYRQETPRQSATSRRPPTQRPSPPSDVQGHEYKPDPLQARTPGEFIDMLAAYRRWAGNPSFREMERNATGQACYSTFSNLLRSKKVPPRLKTVEAFVLALGGDEEDRRRWATAWRRFQALGDERTTPLASGTDELTMIRGGLGERRTG
ncbi:hypothetical protein [Actinomadura mexicana]|uniref:Uncharacterized protein n=1 Tax=Actinomadura mexicana TaxID=134959 RepID=A0A239HGD1_9ACTN|nr:hypothetical protein [Actinomadura mexicana]SNS80201.1 hypothetical protein SAMN06265355_1316 [Actinomadura mexicana]